MTRRAVSCVLAFFVCAAAGTLPARSREVEGLREHLDIPEAALSDAPALEAQMFSDLNALRVGNAHPALALALDERLSTVARGYARRMLRERYIGHTAPDGTTFVDRLRHGGLAAAHMGENLAYTSGDEAEAFKRLVTSPGHLANMLNSHFTRVGIGAVAIGLYGTMYVQEFEGD